MKKIYKGSVLVYEKLLPVGTVLYENSTAGTETIYTIPDGVSASGYVKITVAKL